eukprot:2887567-Prymnesium_polylepis.1
MLTCFDGLPSTIVTPAVSTAYAQGLAITIPAAVTVLARTVLCRSTAPQPGGADSDHRRDLL